MTSRVFYMKGLPSDFALEGAAPDLIRLLEQSDESLEQLTDALSSFEGFLSPSDISEIAGKICGDAGSAIKRLLLNVPHTSLGLFKKRISMEWEEKGAFLKQIEPSRQLDLFAKLDQLIQPYSALERYKKANDLISRTGSKLEEFEMICDLRPIFDENRKKVEGMFPRTILKVVIEGEDGLPVAVEANVTGKQIEEILDKAKKAKQKVECLTREVENWIEGGLPPLPGLKSEDEGESDE